MEPRIVRLSVTPEEFRSALSNPPADMVKIVVDLNRRILTLGGELHADGEQLLLDDGSRQEDLWGANVYPGKHGEDAVEYTSLINIRPFSGNRSLEIEDPARRETVQAIIRELLPLP